MALSAHGICFWEEDERMREIRTRSWLRLLGVAVGRHCGGSLGHGSFWPGDIVEGRATSIFTSMLVLL